MPLPSRSCRTTTQSSATPALATCQVRAGRRPAHDLVAIDRDEPVRPCSLRLALVLVTAGSPPSRANADWPREQAPRPRELLRSKRTDHPKRPGVCSGVGDPSARRLQAAGMVIIPIDENPDATSSPSSPGTGPTTGSPSGLIARRPDHAATTGTSRSCGETRAARSARRRTVSGPSASSVNDRPNEVPITHWPAERPPRRSETRVGSSAFSGGNLRECRLRYERAHVLLDRPDCLLDRVRRRPVDRSRLHEPAPRRRDR